MSAFQSFEKTLNVAIVGASGGIGSAFVGLLAQSDQVDKVYAFSRDAVEFDSDKVVSGTLDFTDEQSIESAAAMVDGALDIIIIASGILHDGEMMPEKSLRNLNMEAMHNVFAVNTFGPALVVKHFTPLMPKDGKSVFAALSARVGSILDNQVGGWYAYRASKSALNMMLKTASIEIGRRLKEAVIVGLHPGTVDTGLSKPFQKQVRYDIFTSEQSAAYLLKVIDEVGSADSGKVLDWDGKEVLP
jgi:NAD(P)-dependent dehydrogenase (short-subunit alcohol dehydrogenase family)